MGIRECGCPSCVNKAVRARGLEPPRAEAHRDLNPARLPVPPRPRCFKNRGGVRAAYDARAAAPFKDLARRRIRFCGSGVLCRKGAAKRLPLGILRDAGSAPANLASCAEKWPREESNLRAQVRSLPLYPLSYGAVFGDYEGQYAAAVALSCSREVAVAQSVELRVVVPVVAGSSPVRHLQFS